MLKMVGQNCAVLLPSLIDRQEDLGDVKFRCGLGDIKKKSLSIDLKSAFGCCFPALGGAQWERDFFVSSPNHHPATHGCGAGYDRREGALRANKRANKHGSLLVRVRFFSEEKEPARPRLAPSAAGYPSLRTHALRWVDGVG